MRTLPITILLGGVAFSIGWAYPVHAQGKPAQPTAQTPPTATQTPPTEQQAPLPAPALGLPRGEKALKISPNPQGTAALPADKPLTIEGAVALALSTNRDLASAVEALSEAQGNTVTTQASQGLTASASYTVDRYNQGQTTNVGGQSVVIENQYSSQATASLSLPIDITGVLRDSTSQAQFQEIAARLDVNRVRNETVLSAKSAFYNVLRDQALVTVAQDDLQNAVDRLADAQQRLAAGTVARYDVLSAQTTVAKGQKTLIQIRTTLSIALATLNSTLGIAVDSPLQVTTAGAVEVPATQDSQVALPKPTALGSTDENKLTGQEGQRLGDAGETRAEQAQSFVVTDPLPFTVVPKYEDLLAEALKNRPEILREDASVAAARKGIAIARRSVLPSASLSYTYTYNPNSSGFSAQQQTGLATLSLSVPLYDAGEARGRVRTANASMAAAETTRRAQVDAVTLDVREAYLNAQQAQEEVTATRQELAQADEAYRLARLRYSAGISSEAGVSPIIEVSDAQQSLTQAQSDYVNALFDYNNDRSALDKAAGRYAYTTEGSGYASPAKR